MRRYRVLILAAVLLVALALVAGCGVTRTEENGTTEDGEVTEKVELDTTRELVFPDDEYPHPGMGMEWWYFTGILNDTQGQRYGYFYTYFLEDGETLILMSVVDLQTGEKVLEEYIDLYGDAAIAEDTLDLDIDGDWQVKLLDNGDFKVKGTGEKASLDLTMHPEKQNVINGDNGYMDMSTGGKSAYYSCTDMSASGTMTFEGKEHQVEGDSWLDRQWGNWKGKATETYDWFSFRFDDGTELMLYSFRDTETGEILEEYNCGTYVDAEGNATNLTDYTVEALGREWTSDETGETYPLRWGVKVPEVGIDVVMEAVVEDQLMIDSMGTTYWEGVCGIVEGNKPGYCYLEMDGYEPSR